MWHQVEDTFIDFPRIPCDASVASLRAIYHSKRAFQSFSMSSTWNAAKVKSYRLSRNQLWLTMRIARKFIIIKWELCRKIEWMNHNQTHLSLAVDADVSTPGLDGDESKLIWPSVRGLVCKSVSGLFGASGNLCSFAAIKLKRERRRQWFAIWLNVGDHNWNRSGKEKKIVTSSTWSVSHSRRGLAMMFFQWAKLSSMR